MEESKGPGRPRTLDKPKRRFTLYLTDEAAKYFNELYAFRIMSGSMPSKSDIWCDAIEMLHANEFNKLKG